VLASLDPATWTRGDPAVMVHAIGSGFTVDCVIVFADEVEPTDFHTDTDVSTALNPDVWQGPDTIDVLVRDLERGDSDVVAFTIQ
jgi:hypothetical protein